MVNTTIIIPKECGHTCALFCLMSPPVFNPKITFTLRGEKEPFRKAELKRRAEEIAVFMFRPRVLDADKADFTSHLKPGDIVIVKVTCTDKDKQEHTKGQEVLVTDLKPGETKKEKYDSPEETPGEEE